ncbi:MAG: hypothetical protein KIS61_30120 [Candidatus Eremiobacteraeota bacterium]|nr:hypothetical protein [Candidatus Eremiobacteraeota bacterium]
MPQGISVSHDAELIGRALHRFKAHELAAICDRLGLGTSALEPFNSKVSYVKDRVLRTPADALVAAVRGIESEMAPYAAEAVRSSEEVPDWLDAYRRLIGRNVDPLEQHIVFASAGKPDLVLKEVPDVHLVDNSGQALIWRTDVPATGLSLADLKAWWADNGDGTLLLPRFQACLGSQPEATVLKYFYGPLLQQTGDSLPVLLPQVWLHYDPLTGRERLGLKALARQRMDFICYLPGPRRVVLEVDGPSHLPKDLKSYGESLQADRALTLRGFLLFRFSVSELEGKGGQDLLTAFFADLFKWSRGQGPP